MRFAVATQRQTWLCGDDTAPNRGRKNVLEAARLPVVLVLKASAQVNWRHRSSAPQLERTSFSQVIGGPVFMKSSAEKNPKLERSSRPKGCQPRLPAPDSRPPLLLPLNRRRRLGRN